MSAVACEKTCSNKRLGLQRVNVSVRDLTSVRIFPTGWRLRANNVLAASVPLPSVRLHVSSKAQPHGWITSTLHRTVDHGYL